MYAIAAPKTSIRRRLLIFLLPPLTALLLVGVFVDYRAALIFARKTNDQRLTDTALALAARIAGAGGAVPTGHTAKKTPDLGVERGPDFSYSIRGPQGQLITGNPQLSSGPRAGGNPSFADATLAGNSVRVASYELTTASGILTVNVATADDSHTGPAHFVLGSTWLMGFIQLDVTLLLVWIGVHFGLKPLLDVRREIEARSDRELQPLQLSKVPAEVRPLVEALNLLFAMLGETARGQRQFVADTAHQLRTPITGLLGHLEVMMQEPVAAPLQPRLASLHAGMSGLAHSANQLLTLARTDPAASLGDRFESVDLKSLSERVLERNLDRSVESQHDLGVDVQAAYVTGSVRLLEDLLGNLVDNALHYTPAGGHITIRCGTDPTYLEVEDDGPGIPAAERSRVRERFYRLPGSTGHGCGLGLAIVDEISRLHAADLMIDAGADGRGTRIRVTFDGRRNGATAAALPPTNRRTVREVASTAGAPGAELRTASQLERCVMSDSENTGPLSVSRKLAQVVSGTMNSATPGSGNAARAARTSPARRQAAGFNLVELMVVTTLASILMAIAVPSYRYVTNSSRVSSEVNSLLGDMMLARAEAIRQGQAVTVCPSTDGATCSSVTDWSNGWIVFTDFNANGTVDTDAANSDTVLRYQAKFGGSDTFTTTNATHDWVSFNRDGFAIQLNTNVNNHLTFKLHTTPVITQWTRCLDITLAGQMTTTHAGTGACS